MMSIRTYLQWKGNGWESMTFPSLFLNTRTTALAIIAKLHPDIITSAATINKIDVSSGTSVPLDINSSITADTILSVAELVRASLMSNGDPFKLIKYEDNKYTMDNTFLIGRFIQEKKCSYCNFIGLDLSNSGLNHAQISNSTLSEVKFIKSSFLWSNISFSTFNNSLLNNSVFRYTNLEESIFSNSVLENIDLSFSHLEKVKILNCKLLNSSLEEISFYESEILYSDFSNSQINKGIFTSTKIEYTDFSSSDLSFANFESSNTYTVSFLNSNMINSNMSHAKLINADLQNTRLNGSDLRFADLTGAKIDLADLSGVNLSNAIWVDGTTIAKNTICAENSIGQCILAQN